MNDAAYGYLGGGALLQNLTIDLAPGTFHFLTGPSGAGKTTFLRMCFADLLPSAGTVSLFEHDVTGLNRDEIAALRRRIGVVHQDTQFLDHLSVAENIALPLTVSNQSLDKEALRDLLAWVGLGPQAGQLPPSLSGGERQRAALARAVIMSPDVILCDEPTGNLDWDMSMRLLHLLIELNRSGKTVVIATHDLHLIRSAKTQVSARVLRISDKNVRLAGADL